MTPLGPICSTLVDVYFCHEAALLCVRTLLFCDVDASLRPVFWSDQGNYLHEADRLLRLVASAAPPANESVFGDAARSTPR